MSEFSQDELGPHVAQMLADPAFRAAYNRVKFRLRLRAAWHELRCWECRVTWRSWLQRLTGNGAGYTPRAGKP